MSSLKFPPVFDASVAGPDQFRMKYVAEKTVWEEQGAKKANVNNVG